MDNKDNFDFYAYLQSISSEIETNDDYNIDIILKKIIFYSSCEIASLFMDDIFILSKTKFKSFDDNKKYNKVMLDILYQTLKQFSPFPFKSIVNLYETLAIGNFDTTSMVFYIKTILSFYFTHEIVVKKIEITSIQQYESQFKKMFIEGYEKMKELLHVIPLIELNNDTEDKAIEKIFRIGSNDEKTAVTLRPLKVKGYNNTSVNKTQEGFFLTDPNTE